MNRRVVAIFAVFLLTAPLSGSIAAGDSNSDYYNDFQYFQSTQSKEIPYQQPITWDDLTPWWETTTMDIDRNGIHDSLQYETGVVNVGISYSRDVVDSDIQ